MDFEDISEHKSRSFLLGSANQRDLVNKAVHSCLKYFILLKATGAPGFMPPFWETAIFNRNHFVPAGTLAMVRQQFLDRFAEIESRISRSLCNDVVVLMSDT